METAAGLTAAVEQEQDRLRESERKFAACFAANPADVALLEFESGVILDVNESWQATTGYRREEAVGRTALELGLWVDRAEKDRYFKELREKRAVRRWEATLARKSGEIFDTLLSAEVVTLAGKSLAVIAGLDITERKIAEEERRRSQQAIADLNVRLERAMAETHHRVKNNLQLIYALMELEAENKDFVPVSHLHQIAYQVQSLSVIHDLLTERSRVGGAVDSLSLRQVLEKLLPLLDETMPGVSIKACIADIHVPGRQAGAVAMLVSELISNVGKYAGGNAMVSLSVEDACARLLVEDDGPGFPAGFDPSTAANNGLDLVLQLVHDDLRGAIAFENRPEGGARVIVSFPLERA
jgi:PAS domain S-box-containing protein